MTWSELRRRLPEPWRYASERFAVFAVLNLVNTGMLRYVPARGWELCSRYLVSDGVTLDQIVAVLVVLRS